jgi:hypothetical protein
MNVSGSVTCKRGGNTLYREVTPTVQPGLEILPDIVHGDGIANTRNWRPWAREIHTREHDDILNSDYCERVVSFIRQ